IRRCDPFNRFAACISYWRYSFKTWCSQIDMPDLRREALCYDPLHGYMPLVSNEGLAAGEVSERQLIDHPWLQRLRQIHQLQTAWWVFPSAEHTRFQHVLGVMHLASRSAAALYDSLKSVCPD